MIIIIINLIKYFFCYSHYFLNEDSQAIWEKASTDIEFVPFKYIEVQVAIAYEIQQFLENEHYVYEELNLFALRLWRDEIVHYLADVISPSIDKEDIPSILSYLYGDDDGTTKFVKSYL